MTDKRVVSKWDLGCMERVVLDVMAGIPEEKSVRLYPPQAKAYRKEFEAWVAALPPGSIVDIPDSGANECWGFYLDADGNETPYPGELTDPTTRPGRRTREGSARRPVGRRLGRPGRTDRPARP